MRPHQRALGESAPCIGCTETPQRVSLPDSEQKEQGMHTKHLRAEATFSADESKETKNKKTPHMGRSWKEGSKQTLSSSTPLVKHSLCFSRFLFLKITLKAKREELQSTALGSSGCDKAKQSGANKVRASAKQRNQLLNTHAAACSDTLAEEGERQAGKWAVQLLEEEILSAPLHLL